MSKKAYKIRNQQGLYVKLLVANAQAWLQTEDSVWVKTKKNGTVKYKTK